MEAAIRSLIMAETVERVDLFGSVRSFVVVFIVLVLVMTLETVLDPAGFMTISFLVCVVTFLVCVVTFFVTFRSSAIVMRIIVVIVAVVMTVAVAIVRETRLNHFVGFGNLNNVSV